jgi:hypothetical protein
MACLHLFLPNAWIFAGLPARLYGDVIIAVDSTWIKVPIRDEWMQEKWKVRRGWI